ncbi:MAG: glutamine amidotransferase [Planctomycetaceae bacterium]|jgi:uncharacterized membrane protein|nr:glutamine amidotransferase [Planctomycetaceae bacterium]
MAAIYYVGDWAVMIGPIFAETPFNYAVKGTDIFNYGKWLKNALESSGDHEVHSVPAWEFYRLAPGEYEKIIDRHDILIFSDVEAKNFQLVPSFFDRRQFGTKPLTFPDRVRLTTEALKNGKHMMFLGGWLSFNGEMGKGGWGRTGLKEILPVECLEYEDLCESTEGWSATPLLKEHPILNGIDLSTLPPVLGYNKVKPRNNNGKNNVNTEVVAVWKDTDDPMIATGQFGKGRVLAYTSDPAPHWGCNFVYWDKYCQLWQNAVRWLLSRQH